MNRICIVLCTFTALWMADASAQIMPQQNTDESTRKIEEITQKVKSGPERVPKEVKVTVETDKPRAVLMPWTLGVHTLASDSHLTDREVVGALHAAGITTLRYPGGRIADTFHWSTDHMLLPHLVLESRASKCSRSRPRQKPRTTGAVLLAARLSRPEGWQLSRRTGEDQDAVISAGRTRGSTGH